jgi:sugar lactone lactonase YvrE
MPSRTLFAIIAAATLLMSADLLAAPAGYVKQTIPLQAPPAGLAFDAAGNLFALENPGFGNNAATLRWIHPDLSMGSSFTVVGNDEQNFFVGSMTYDSITDRVLISDNTADGRLYAIDKLGNQQTIATDLAGVAGVAVRGTGEIIVTTSPSGRAGEVLQVDRATGHSTIVLDDLGFGAGLAFDSHGDLFVQDADATFAGRIRRLPITANGGGLTFGAPQSVADGMASGAGVALDSEDDVFTTGNGGLYTLLGAPAVETPFDNNGDPAQFATAIAFAAGQSAFEPFAGPQGGRLAYMADFGFTMQDSFVTLLTPARSEDANSNGLVNGEDLTIWKSHVGLTPANPEMGDANQDGSVDGADFLRWQRAASGQVVVSVVVPEPAAGVLFIFLGTLLFAWQNRRRG